MKLQLIYLLFILISIILTFLSNRFFLSLVLLVLGFDDIYRGGNVNLP